ncbi:tumor protein p53-inducible protein 13 isoform X4 [Mustela erminea]|uniref:tumor protein p53-inducible protein 13 isoform X4 n=1 Tax=Mustela erminea TaxID=36723 RepID=UPI00138663DB|nr:tumor protein p53-inducible protein 13 isoform X4 [Mustela erminea]
MGPWQGLQVILTCLKRVCRRSVPPEPLASLGSHFPPFAPLHDPTQAAGRGDAMGRKRGRRRDSPRVWQHRPLRPGILHETFPASSLGRVRAKSAVVGGPWRGRGGARVARSCGGGARLGLGARAWSVGARGLGVGVGVGVGAGRRARAPGFYVGIGAVRGATQGRALPGLPGGRQLPGRTGMAPPPPSPQLLLLATLAGLLGPSEVVAEPEEEVGARCPEGLWPLPPQVSPRVTYARRSRWQAEDVRFFYHPCAHPWLKLQLALLAHVCVVQPSLAADPSLTQERPLVLAAWGVVLEMAWIEPARAAHLLKRRWRRRQRKKAWLYSDGLSGSLVPRPGRGRLCWRGCVQAPALAFTLWSWQPPGAEEATGGPRHLSPGGAKRRGLRAALGLRPTPSGPRFSSASPQSQGPQQPMLAARAAGGEAPSVPTPPVLSEGLGRNASSGLEAPVPKGQSSSGSCTCPGEASPAPQAAVPPRVARGPTPRTEEAAWAAMALTFLLVLLTLATLCTRLHRNFRRGDSIYWEPTADSQDTVAAVLKRRLLMPPRRVKRSRRRPLLPPTPDSGPDGDSSD